MAETTSPLMGFCWVMRGRKWPQGGEGQCQGGWQQASPSGCGRGKASWGRRTRGLAFFFFCGREAAQPGPAWPLKPHHAGQSPSPGKASPHPGRPPLCCDSRNWALSVGPSFRSCFLPFPLSHVAAGVDKVGGNVIKLPGCLPGRGSGNVSQIGEWLECGWGMWEPWGNWADPTSVSRMGRPLRSES